MWFWPDTVMSLLPVPPASITPSFNIMMCLSLSLTLPETARRLSSNLCDEEDFNAVIHHLPFFFHLSVSVYCAQSSRRLCHPANVPPSHLFFLSFPSLSLSLNLHSVEAQDHLKDKVSSRPPLVFLRFPPTPPLPLVSLHDQRGLWGFWVTGEVG